MYEVRLTDYSVTVISKNGKETEVTDENPNYRRARNAALDGNWDEYYELANDYRSKPDVGVVGLIGVAESIPDMLAQIAAMTGVGIVGEDDKMKLNDVITQMKGLIEDGIVDPSDLGLETVPEIGEHDLSNWNGSPIYYDNEDEARSQAEKSMGFWKFHDFGVNSPSPLEYRYATVPTGFGPTAPSGYDWICLKRK